MLQTAALPLNKARVGAIVRSAASDGVTVTADRA
jgi:hypothetical protein